MATFEYILPNFCSSNRVVFKAYIYKDTIGKYGIVFGKRFCAELGIIMIYKRKTMIWDGLSIPMSRKYRMKHVVSISGNPGDRDLPDFMQTATQSMSKILKIYQYDRYSYVDMVDKFMHLDKEKKMI